MRQKQSCGHRFPASIKKIRVTIRKFEVEPTKSVLLSTSEQVKHYNLVFFTDKDRTGPNQRYLVLANCSKLIPRKSKMTLWLLYIYIFLIYLSFLLSPVVRKVIQSNCYAPDGMRFFPVGVNTNDSCATRFVMIPNIFFSGCSHQWKNLSLET